MAAIFLLGFMSLGSLTANAAEKTELRENAFVGSQTKTRLHLVVRGKVQTSGKEETLAGQALLEYPERVLAVGEDGFPSKLARFYDDARAKFVIGTAQDARQLRRHIRFQVGEIKDQRLTLWSPAGPLTGDEVELVEEVLDTSRLTGLLPAEPVAPGDSWEPPAGIVQSLCDYEHFVSSTVKCTLAEVAGGKAKIKVAGAAEGLGLATEIKSTVDATLVFNIEDRFIEAVEWSQTDTRSAGPVSPAGAYQITISITRSQAKSPSLSDEVIEKATLEPTAAAKLLVYEDANSRFKFHFQRGWHLTASRPDAIIFRKLDDSELIGQLNVTILRPKTAGTRMSSEEFQAAVESSAQIDIEEILKADNLPTDGSFHLQTILATGKNDGVSLHQRHYLATSPAGGQVIFSFLLEPQFAERLGTEDLSLVGAIEFPSQTTAKETAPNK